MRARGVQLEHLVGRRPQPARAVQIHDRIHHAHENQAIALMEPLVGTDCGNHFLTADDFQQVEPTQMA